MKFFFEKIWLIKLILKVQLWHFLRPWRYVNPQKTAISLDYLQLIFDQKPLLFRTQQARNSMIQLTLDLHTSTFLKYIHDQIIIYVFFRRDIFGGSKNISRSFKFSYFSERVEYPKPRTPLRNELICTKNEGAQVAINFS